MTFHSTNASTRATIAGLRLIATFASIGAVGVAGALLWLLPWPIDALLAAGVAATWTSWLEHQEPS
jgi:hypothetical protein